MFGWIGEKIVTGMAVRQLQRDPVVQIGRDAIRHNWTENPVMTKTFRSNFRVSKNYMPKIAEQMMQIVIGVATAQDPRMANRQRLVDVVAELAVFEILTLPPPPAPDSTGLRGKPGITGELRQRLPEIAHKDQSLRDFFFSAGGVEKLSPDDLQNSITMRRYVLHSWSQLHQTLRMAWRDASPEEPLADWYRPLVENMCAFKEHHFRQLLGMEPALGKSGRSPDLEALARSTLMNFVLEGATDPLTKWKEYYKDWNLDPDLDTPTATPSLPRRGIGARLLRSR